jgi:signal transduction histidine kinase
MLNLTDVALLGYQGSDPPSSLVGVRESAEQMRKIIDDLLFLARAEHGVGGEVDHKPVDLVELLESLRELYAPVCDERGTRLRLAAPSDRVVVPTNRGLLERAVSNLIDNAVRHAPDGGEVEISLAARAGRMELTVSDSGPGIPESDRERIFDRFVQLDPSRRTDGAGLGLPLVRAIARLLGGDARAEASPLGGASLIVTLGCSSASGDTTASASAPGELPASLRRASRGASTAASAPAAGSSAQR